MSVSSSGAITTTGNVAGTASYASNAELLDGLDSTVFTLTSSFAAQTASFTAFTASQNILNGTYATTGSNTFTGIQTVNSNLIVTGSITAQTLVVQTVTSSVIYSSGSNVFGNNIANTQSFTGSVSMTGSLAVVTNGTEFQVTTAGVNFGNALTDSHNVTGSLRVTGSLSIGSGSFPQTFAVKISGSTYNSANVWFQDGSATDGMSFGGNGINSFKTIDTYGGALHLNSVSQNGVNMFGNVGIGTTGPNANLTVWTPSTTGMQTALRLNNPFGFTNANTGAKIVFSQDRTTAEDYPMGEIGVGQESAGSSSAGYMFFSTRNSSAISERMRITSAGNVGISTTTPARKLVVQDTAADPFISIMGAYPNQGGILFGDTTYTDSSCAIRIDRTNNALWFSTGGASSERMRIRSDGTVLIGTTTTSLATSGIHLVNNGEIYIPIINSLNTLHVYDRTNSLYRFYVSGGGTINATNTAISAISDVRLKENIVDLEIGLDAIMALRPRKFDWKKESGNSGKNVRGFIAQEFEEIFPDLIDESINPSPEGEEPYKQIRQDLIPTLVKAIQELKAEIEELKNK